MVSVYLEGREMLHKANHVICLVATRVDVSIAVLKTEIVHISLRHLSRCHMQRCWCRSAENKYFTHQTTSSVSLPHAKCWYRSAENICFTHQTTSSVSLPYAKMLMLLCWKQIFYTSAYIICLFTTREDVDVALLKTDILHIRLNDLSRCHTCRFIYCDVKTDILHIVCLILATHADEKY